jgi:hypothetical protein
VGSFWVGEGIEVGKFGSHMVWPEGPPPQQGRAGMAPAWHGPKGPQPPEVPRNRHAKRDVISSNLYLLLCIHNYT